MPSPLCQVKENAGAYVSTSGGVNVTPGNTVTINLIDTSADSWSIECVYTDDTSVAATVTSSLTIDTNLRTAVFTAPAAGKTYIFRSRVNNGVGPDGKVKSSYSTTFGIYTLTAGGLRVIAANETTEGGAFGWVEPVNTALRAGLGGGAAGKTIVAMADADQAITVEEAQRGLVQTTGTNTEKRTLEIEPPDEDDESFLVTFLNTCAPSGTDPDAGTVTLSVGTGAEIDIEAGAKALLQITSAGVTLVVDLPLDPRDFGCKWNGIDDDTPGLIAMQQAIPERRSRTTEVKLPKGEGWCASDLPIFRKLHVVGQGQSGLQAHAAPINGIRFALLKGMIIHGSVSAADQAESGGYGDGDGTHIDGVNLASQIAIPSDSLGNWGHAMSHLSTLLDTWEQLPATVKVGTCVLKSGVAGAAVTVSSSPLEYYGDGHTRDTTHLVMFRCTTAGTKGSAKPAEMASGSGTGLGDIGDAVAATGGTAVWTVESLPKDYVNGASVALGQRVFFPGDNSHVFKCIEAGSTTDGEVTTLHADMNGLTFPQGTIRVASTAGFPSTGILRITSSTGYQYVAYTGKTTGPDTFTGCSRAENIQVPTGTMATGGAVSGPYSWVSWGMPVISLNQMRQPSHRAEFYDASTAVAGGSIGATLPQGTLNVTTTAGFADSGTVKVWIEASLAYVTVTYTGRTETTFTGCTGGTGVMVSGAEVGQGCKWQEEHNGAVAILANWVTFENATIRGFTNGAFWVSPTYKRTFSGGAHYFKIARCYLHYCGSGFKNSSFNSNGGETHILQADFMGGGRSNVDGPTYLNTVPTLSAGNWGTGRFGNAGDIITDRQLGLSLHVNHYTQFSGGMGYRNDLFTGSVPGGNNATFDQCATENDLLPIFTYPAVVRNPPHGVNQNTSATVFGVDSRNIRTSSPLVSNPAKKILTTVGPQDPAVAAAFRMQHSDDTHPVDWHCSEDFPSWGGTKWFMFGKGDNSGWFIEQFFAVPRVGATLPGGHSLGAIAPPWITQEHVFFGLDPSVVPHSLGMLTGSNRISVYGDWTQAGSFFFNTGVVPDSADTRANQPLGWRTLTSGSPGTIQTIYAPKRGEDTQAMADANQTATGTQNSLRTHVLTGALTGDRTWFLAVPATNADGAEHVIDASGISGGNIVVDLVGSVGTTVTIAAGKTAMVRTNTGGVKRQTADV